MAFPPLTPPPLNMSEDENPEDEDEVEDPYKNIHSDEDDEPAFSPPAKSKSFPTILYVSCMSINIMV